MIFGAWHVPKSVELFLQNGKLPVPAPVPGWMLWDTGAASTCISQTAANKLRLEVMDVVQGFGAGGAHESPVYLGRLAVNIQNAKDEKTAIGFEEPVKAIPDLEKAYRGLTLNGAPVECIGLLGRDFMRFCKFSYDGIAGQVSFHIATQAVAGNTAADA